MVRPLRQREREALSAVLSMDFVGAPELRKQARTVTAVGDGLLISLLPDPGVPAAPLVGRVVVEAPVVDLPGGHTAGLILFTDEGRLSALEYWWTTEDPPEDFPPRHSVGPPVVTF